VLGIVNAIRNKHRFVLAASIGWLIMSLSEATYFGNQVWFGARLPRPVPRILALIGALALIGSLVFYGIAIRRKEVVIRNSTLIGAIAGTALVLLAAAGIVELR
jgi:hypothetical protein